MARRALILANDSFADPAIPALASPCSDGERLRGLLAREDVGGYEVEYHANPSSVEARIAVQSFFRGAGAGDFNLILISGHGIRDSQGHLHFATSDTRSDVLAATSLDAAFVIKQMDLSAASKQVAVIDTCYSGAFVHGMVAKAATQRISRTDFDNAEIDNVRGRAVITASTHIQVANENEVGGLTQSVFTRHLIEGIETGAADADGDGVIALPELFDYVSAKLKAEGSIQTPRSYDYGLGGRVVIALSPVRSAAELPAALRKKLASRSKAQKLLAVEQLDEIAIKGGVEAELAVEALQALLRDEFVLVRQMAQDALNGLGAEAPLAPVPVPPPVAEPIEDTPVVAPPPAEPAPLPARPVVAEEQIVPPLAAAGEAEPPAVHSTDSAGDDAPGGFARPWVIAVCAGLALLLVMAGHALGIAPIEGNVAFLAVLVIVIAGFLAGISLVQSMRAPAAPVAGLVDEAGVAARSDPEEPQQTASAVVGDAAAERLSTWKFNLAALSGGILVILILAPSLGFFEFGTSVAVTLILLVVATVAWVGARIAKALPHRVLMIVTASVGLAALIAAAIPFWNSIAAAEAEAVRLDTYDFEGTWTSDFQSGACSDATVSKTVIDMDYSNVTVDGQSFSRDTLYRERGWIKIGERYFRWDSPHLLIADSSERGAFARTLMKCPSA